MHRCRCLPLSPGPRPSIELSPPDRVWAGCSGRAADRPVHAPHQPSPGGGLLARCCGRRPRFRCRRRCRGRNFAGLRCCCLQLAVLAAFVVTLARPFYRERTLLGPHTAFVFDTSGSMAHVGSVRYRPQRGPSRSSTTCPRPTRSRWSRPDRNPRVLLAFGRDPELVEGAFNQLEVGGGSADLSGAVRLARGLATPDRPTNVLLLTDGGDHSAPRRTGGRGGDAAFRRLRRQPGRGGVEPRTIDRGHYPGLSQRRQLRSRDPNRGGRGRGQWSCRLERVELEVPGLGTRARETTPVDAGPGDRLTVRLVDNSDALPLDDRATLIVGSAPEQMVNVIGEGSPFLEALVDAVPGFTNQGEGDTDLASLSTGSHSPRSRSADLADCPRSDSRRRHRSASSPGTWPSLISGRENRFSIRSTSPGWWSVRPRWWWRLAGSLWSARVTFLSSCLGEINGHRVAYFTFDITKSNLPMQVGFPILGARILELARWCRHRISVDRSGREPRSVWPLRPVSVAQVTMPDGRGPRSGRRFGPVRRHRSARGVSRSAYLSAEELTPGPIAIRTFVADESAGRPG